MSGFALLYPTYSTTLLHQFVYFVVFVAKKIVAKKIVAEKMETSHDRPAYPLPVQ